MGRKLGRSRSKEVKRGFLEGSAGVQPSFACASNEEGSVVVTKFTGKVERGVPILFLKLVRTNLQEKREGKEDKWNTLCYQVLVG